MTTGAGSETGRRPRAPVWLPALGLAAVGAVVWRLDVVGGTVLHSLANFDLFAEFLPRHSYAAEALRRGALPLWDPHQIAGLPFLATLQGGVLYPPNWLYAALPVGTAMGWLGLAHLVLAGVFAFGLCRALGASRAGSWLGGATFMLCGSTLFMSFHTNAMNAAPWLPAALYCAVRLARESSLRWALWLAACVALQFLAGRDYAFVMTLHALALLTLFQAVWMLRDGRGLRRVLAHAGRLAVAAALALGLVAAQALPTLALAERGVRPLAGLDPAMLEIFGPMPPALFFANLVHPVRGVIRREYFGWIPLLCFALSFRLWGRERTPVFASVLALLALLLCFGSQTPLYAAYRALPLGATFRLPDRFVYLLSLGVALGAAWGFDRLLAARAGWKDLVPNLALVGGAGAALAYAVWSGGFEAGLADADRPWGWFTLYGLAPDHYEHLSLALVYLALAALALGLAAWRAGRVARLALPALAVADLAFALHNPFLHPARSTFNALSSRDCYAQARLATGAYGRYLSFRLRDSHALKDKDGELFGGYAATHYDPLVTRRHELYFAALQQGGTPLVQSSWNEKSPFMGFLAAYPRPERAVLLDLLGVRALLVDGRPGRRPPALEALLEGHPKLGRCRVDTDSGVAPVDLHANPRALPRAFVVRRVSGAPDAEHAVRRLLAADFDPRREAVIEAPVPPGLAQARAEPLEPARIVAYEERRVVVRARADAPGLLVLTDAYDPDWRARRGEEAVAIHPADGLFRGVFVPAGESELVFEYQPPALRWGIALSALTAGGWLLLWWRTRRRSGPGRA